MNRYESPKAQGFTLIEIMIVVAIIGILAAIAIPAYTSSILKGKRAQARTALAEMMQQQERYMTQRNTYLVFTTSAAGVTAPASAATTFKVSSGDNAADPAYWINADACPGLGVTECIRLNAVPTKADPEGGTLSMTSTGVKTCTGTTTNPKLCWP